MSDEILRRLEALEAENAALRARLDRRENPPRREPSRPTQDAFGRSFRESALIDSVVDGALSDGGLRKGFGPDGKVLRRGTFTMASPSWADDPSDCA